jgi:hypothetical protein
VCVRAAAMEFEGEAGDFLMNDEGNPHLTIPHQRTSHSRPNGVSS